MARPRIHAGCGAEAVVVMPDEAVRIARMLSVPMASVVAVATVEGAPGAMVDAGFRVSRDGPERVLQLVKHPDEGAPVCRFVVPTRGRRLCGLGSSAPAACLGVVHPTSAWLLARAAWHHEVDAGPWTQPDDVFFDWAMWAFPEAGGNG